ncbi:hypothetical protein CerSpe_067250 [Prunus speciosa]
MPVKIGGLKRLRTLTTFVVDKSTGSSIGELTELTNLQGKLCILNLQNVLDAMVAFRANLKEKKDLKELELEWDYSTKEKDVLDMLQPPLKLVKLTLKFYGGITFPKWFEDSAFSNIQFICLSGCSYPLSLPPLGQLPVLQELTIKSMKSVTTVAVEFYSCNGSSVFRPFQSLKKLKFDEMPEWEEWLPSPGGGNCLDFARHEKLILRKCSNLKLRGNLPNYLRSLKKPSVSSCEVLHERVTPIICSLKKLSCSGRTCLLSGPTLGGPARHGLFDTFNFN